ncbi:MAG: AAA family ATPase [Oscillospiraceae bacterium]|nr:AAA family ATPase [Oscillospiraceae bacterium]
MAAERLELALYGKGGIGKSTISANLSAALAEAGHRVLQIGCDPKHDSTRLLMGGRALPTVLEYLKDVPKEAAEISAVLGEGCRGIGCIEAGGPRPGVGCAGRGIISAFEFLERNRVKERYDVVLYDVLGDVVCGGFAVPIRREYANAIFLVTSGEFMALYAANNILRGVRNFDGDRHRRVAGILYNRRNVAGEDQRVERFARAVGLPVCAVIPRSDAFAVAEEKKRPLIELDGYPEEHAVFSRLAEQIGAGLTLYEARPLSDEDLEAVVLNGRTVSPLPAAAPAPASAAARPAPAAAEETERPDPYRMPLFGCAFNGASTAAIHLTDAIVIAHSPRACAFYTWQNISSPGRRNLFNRGILMPSAISPNYECSEIGQSEAVFGGMDALRESVRLALERKPGAVIVISSCVSGIIGDDVQAVEDMSVPETPVIVIPADGDINGDYMTGIEMCMHTLAEKLVDPSVPKKPDTVNLIGETGVANNTDINYRTIKALLGGMGIDVNCRFLGDATAAEVRALTAAPLNILAVDSPDNRKLQLWLREKYGCEFMDECLPVGYRATAEFLERVGAFFGRPEAARPVIEREKALFDAEAARLRQKLGGKKVLMTTINANLDWLLDAAEAVGMEFVWIGVLNYLRQELKITDHPERRAIVEEIGSASPIRSRIDELRPDIVLSNYTAAAPEGEYIIDNLPMGQLNGFRSGLEVMDRWARLIESRREGEWMRDQQLFEKYFA